MDEPNRGRPPAQSPPSVAIGESSLPPPSDPPAGGRGRRWLSVALWTGFIFLGAAAIRQGSLVKRPFDPSLIAKLDAHQPRFVFLGDSMLGTRITADVFDQAAQQRCEVLTRNGSGSATWYLMIKNLIAAQQHPPAWIVIFFRDRQLTLPAFRVSGRYRGGIEELSHDSEPEFETVMTQCGERDGSWVEHSAQLLFPVRQHHVNFQIALQEAVLCLGRKLPDRHLIHDHSNELFDVKNLRGDVAPLLDDEDDIQTSVDPPDHGFAENVDHSFLPLICREAAKRNMRLLFYHIKRRPRSSVSKSELAQYDTELKAYLTTQHAAFADENDDAAVDVSSYGEGDHLRDSLSPEYTRRFWERLRPIFAPTTAMRTGG